MAEEPILKVRGITKYFGDICANDRIHFDLHKGEIHALLGETEQAKPR